MKIFIEKEEYRGKIRREQRGFFIFLSSLAALVLFLFGFLNCYIFANQVVGLLEVGGGLLIFLNLFTPALLGRLRPAVMILALVVLLELNMLLVSGGLERTGILWFYVFPLAALFLLGKKWGGIWTLALFSTSAITILLGRLNYLPLAYSNIEIAQAFMSLSIVFIMAYVYERIRERKERLTSKAKEDYFYLIKNAPIPIAVLDDSGYVRLVNHQAEKISGYNEKELIGKHFLKTGVLVQDKSESVEKEFNLLISGVRRSPFELAMKTKDGRDLIMEVNQRPLKQDGRIVGAQIIFIDKTKEKELDRAKDEFISIASHQLKTPLAAILWLVESIKNSFRGTKLTRQQNLYLDDLNNSTERAVRLVEDLLNVSRLQLGTFKEEKKETDIISFIADFISKIMPYAEMKKHKIVFERRNGIPLLITLDQKKLSNVLQNLVSNGIEYSPVDTTVTVVLEKENGYIRVSVSNEGPPIPEEEQKHLFEKFYRGESAKKIKSEGTGLGLYLVKSFVESMGGEIGFSSGEDKNTTFWFTIPYKGKKSRKTAIEIH